MSTVTDRAGRAGYEAARACTILFACSALLSYLYVITTGTYNGDFYGVPERLGLGGQTLMLFASVLPYVFAWCLYKWFKARPSYRTICVPQGRLTAIFFVIVAWFIFLALAYDVGVMGKPLYEAPAPIKALIQVSNRINPFYLGVLFILAYRGRTRFLWMGIVMLVTLGIARAGLGVLLYIFMALLIRNYAALSVYVRRNKIKIALVILVFPTVVSQLYSLRSALRDDASVELVMSASEVLVARLVGRLSSFSDSAVAVQEEDAFTAQLSQVEDFYFAKQVFGGVFGVAFFPQLAPERMLINIYGGDYEDVSYMVGLPGNLYWSWLVSPLIFFFNLALVLLMSLCIFAVARKLRTPYANEYALMLLLYPLTSGVGNEFSTLLTALFSFCVLFAITAVPILPRATRTA